MLISRELTAVVDLSSFRYQRTKSSNSATRMKTPATRDFALNTGVSIVLARWYSRPATMAWKMPIARNSSGIHICIDITVLPIVASDALLSLMC